MFEREFLEKFKGLNVLIVGDVMLDRYWWGSVSRISPEAPVPVVNLDNTSLVSGGAANVAANIAGLGAVPHLVGVIGDDAEGELLIEILTKENISPNSLTIIPKRPTTTKTRILAHSQQIARVDQETKSEISPDQEALVWENVSRLLSYAQVIIISDYGKGVITQNISQRLITTAKANNQLIIIDPKGKNYQKYKGATMLTPNRFEAAEVSQLTVYNQESVEKAGNQMLKDFELESVLITQGEDGMTLFHKQERAERKPYSNVSIEKVFRQIARGLNQEEFEVKFQSLSYFNTTLGTIKNLLFYRKQPADIYHVTGHNHYIALVLPEDRTVLTIHDVGILHIRKGLRRYLIKKINFDLPLRKLKYITTISEATKKEIIYFTNCPPEKIRVIGNPIQDNFVLPADALQDRKFETDCPTILQIGTAYNKNLKNLILALKGVRCRLVIIGRLDDETENLLKTNRINFENRFDLTDEEIRSEYLKTDIVVFCSTFEGFGLPIIEAQSMRKPVLTSNISPLKEVAGNSAALADPNDFTSIRKRLKRIINDQAYRENLITKGFENVKRFSSGKVVGLYENLYSEIKENTSKSHPQK
jgi:rfaE bifunctional protein kinase chain/domain